MGCWSADFAFSLGGVVSWGLPSDSFGLLPREPGSVLLGLRALNRSSWAAAMTSFFWSLRVPHTPGEKDSSKETAVGLIVMVCGRLG